MTSAHQYSCNAQSPLEILSLVSFAPYLPTSSAHLKCSSSGICRCRVTIVLTASSASSACYYCHQVQCLAVARTRPFLPTPCTVATHLPAHDYRRARRAKRACGFCPEAVLGAAV